MITILTITTLFMVSIVYLNYQAQIMECQFEEMINVRLLSAFRLQYKSRRKISLNLSKCSFSL